VVVEQRFDFPHQQLAFEEMQKRVLEAQARVGRLEAALTEAVDAWCCAAGPQSTGPGAVSGWSALRRWSLK
jgi:hypothetical protein